MLVLLSNLNQLPLNEFVGICGPFFEHSAWVAERAWAQRPFATLKELHRRLCKTVSDASIDEQLTLIGAHPDLVGKAALKRTLTTESNREQAAAGLGNLSLTEIEIFQKFNAEYRAKFGFPFVICARENKKEAILAAFSVRQNNSPSQERTAALAEIEKIAWFRLYDAIQEG